LIDVRHGDDSESEGTLIQNLTFQRVALLQFSHVRRQVLQERSQLRIFQQIAFHVTDDTRDIGKKFGIVFDLVDIDKPAGRLKISLDTGEVEQAAKRRRTLISLAS